MFPKRFYSTLFTIIVGLAFCSQVRAQATAATENNYTVVAVEPLAGRVGFYNAATAAKMGSVDIGFKPHEVEISKDGKTAYVANFGIEDYNHRIGTPGNSISVIDIPRMKEKYTLSTQTQGTDSSTFRGPHGIKLRPSKEKELFVNTEFGGDFMLVYDLKKRKLKRSYAVPAGSHNFIFSADGRFLYLFAGQNGVFKLNPETGAILAKTKLSTPARGLHYTSDGRSIIATGIREIALLNPGDLSVERHFKLADVGQMLYPKPTPDGKYILLPAPYNQELVVLEISSGNILHRLKVGKTPIAVAISPDGTMAYVSSHEDNYFCKIDLTTFEFSKFAEAGGSNGIGVTKWTK